MRTPIFDIVDRGDAYDVATVTLLTNLAMLTREHPDDPYALTPDELRRMQIPRARHGYSAGQVEEWLDFAIDRMEGEC